MSFNKNMPQLLLGMSITINKTQLLKYVPGGLFPNKTTMEFLCCLGQSCITVTSECTTHCLFSIACPVIPSYVAWRLMQVFLSNVEPGDLVRVELGDWVCLQPEDDDDEFNLPLPPICKTKHAQQTEDIPWMYTLDSLGASSSELDKFALVPYNQRREIILFGSNSDCPQHSLQRRVLVIFVVSKQMLSMIHMTAGFGLGG